MIYPCKKCSHDTGKCRCLDWKRWFSVEFEAEAAKVLASDEITVTVDMGLGAFDATAWGCDLTYDYVKINGDYRT